eukprot:s544_g4.t1
MLRFSCGIIHADIKPDNILISAGHNVVKICDLGSAMELTEVEPTPYLVSRFYRAPEIVLAAKYSFPLDVFAMGCTLFELFTGKILFPGKTNNDMLRLFMEVKGKLPNKLIKSGTVWKNHFDDNMDFKFFDVNKATRKKITRTITDLSAKRSVVEMVLNRVGPDKQKSTEADDQLYMKKAKQFADIIDKMTAMDPDRRTSANDGLSHAFLAEAGPGSKPAEKAAEKAGTPKAEAPAPKATAKKLDQVVMAEAAAAAAPEAGEDAKRQKTEEGFVSRPPGVPPPPAQEGEAKPEAAAEAKPEEPVETEVDAKPLSGKPLKENMTFEPADCTLNVIPSLGGKVLLPLSEGGLQYLMAGARANMGMKSGRYLYEVKVIETLNPSEGPQRSSRTPLPRQLLRLGFSALDSPLHLAENDFSVSFDSEGFFYSGKTRHAVSQRLCKDQVIAVLLNLDPHRPQCVTYT